ncbi:hypothetical protein LX99_03869 [Mucilaginibacter oryzae]|uniref:Uncharacterized protein n=1 Tax=Mucilaginibacter oryzae TaxID=468058 RepID=A0A316HAK6_9SPHI|nr:hypothetical protein LX99_03869 [Mucilaginibacter oryzae]
MEAITAGGAFTEIAYQAIKQQQVLIKTCQVLISGLKRKVGITRHRQLQMQTRLLIVLLEISRLWVAAQGCRGNN